MMLPGCIITHLKSKINEIGDIFKIRYSKKGEGLAQLTGKQKTELKKGLMGISKKLKDSP